MRTCDQERDTDWGWEEEDLGISSKDTKMFLTFLLLCSTPGAISAVTMTHCEEKVALNSN